MNLKRLADSLITRLLALGLLILATGTAVSYVQLTRFLRQDLTNVVSAQQMALAKYVAADVDRSLQDRLVYLERLAGALPAGWLGQPERLCPWLAERHDLQPAFSLGFTVTDGSGKVLIDCPRQPGRPSLSTADQAEVRAALAGTAVIGRPARAPRSGQPALSFAAPIMASAGPPSGVLIGTAEMAADGFLDLTRQGRIGHSGSLLMISPTDKLFIGATDPQMLFTPTPPQGVNPLHDRAMAGFRGSGTTVNARGIEEISAIAAVPSTGWFVVARSPTGEMLATVGRTQSLILWQRVPTLLLVLAVIGMVLVRWLRPLFRAAHQAERMTRGEAPLAPLPVVRDDEIGHLTTAFNRLLAKLGQQQDELERMAHHDGLTDLPNRQLFADRLQQARARAQRDGNRLALLFLDLDGFKLINDTLGHEAGDEALKETARRLTSVVRETDTVARLGGDEFVLLAVDIESTGDASVQVLAEKCIAAVSQPMVLNGAVRTVGVSVGIALSDGHQSADTLLAAADQAMYAAKEKKRGAGAALTLPL